MADELTIGATLKYEKTNRKVSFTKTGIQIDVSGIDFIHHTQSVGTSEEALTLGSDMPTLGYCMMFNHDSTNFMEVRPATGVADLVKIKAGEVSLFRFADAVTAPFVIADTAAVQIEYVIIED